MGLLCAGLLSGASALEAAQPRHPTVDRPSWPALADQLDRDHVVPGSALQRLIEDNQNFELLRPEESVDHLRIPLWLRVLWHKQHPDEVANPNDPTGGYPLVLNEVYEWMLTHQNLQPGRPGPRSITAESQTESGEGRISGAQTSPRSETDIRVNYWNTQKIIGASNDISSSGRQAMFYSSNGGASWSQTYLPLNTGDAFQSDPTVDWTSDGTAWSTTIGINSAQTSLQMRAYKSTDGGATWTFDATFSTGTNNDKQMIWVDHSATSPYKDNLYAIWHNGNPAFINRRTGPTGSWQSPIQVSGSETTGTAIGDDIKTNAYGDVFGFFPDTGSRRLNVVKSTNGGASFSAPVSIATSYGSFQIAVPADASRQVLIYLTGGAYRTSTKNNVYAAWTDLSGASGCTSGGGPGTNASSTCKTRIWFSRSTDGGSTWSTPVKINDQSSLNDQIFPWLVVDETSGKIAITYYDTVGDTTRTSTNVYYQSSTDDGATWTAPFKVTTASTNETTSGADSGNQYGDYTGLSGYASTFFPAWTDRRSGASEEIWSAAIADNSADFAIAASPTSLSLAAGGSGSSTITTTASGSFNNSISLSASGMPSGVTVSFSPTSIAAPGTGTSTMTVTVGGSVANGTYPITVTGTGGSTVRTTTVTLTVATPDFSIAASPASLSVLQGSAGTSTITTAVVGGFNNAVSLAASGAPTGVTVSFSPTSIAAPGSGSSTMTLAVASSAVAGTYPITVTGTGGSSTHSTSVSLTVTAPPPAGVTNGGFETGNLTGWTSSGSATVTAGAAHSGGYGVQLGTTPSPSTDSSVVQTFTLPSNAQTLTFWYDNHCPDTITYDWATATLTDNVTATTTTVLAKTCAASATWTQVSTNVAASAGHSVTLTLSNHDDNYSGDATYTWYDDVAIATSSSVPSANFTFTTSGLAASFTDTSTDSGGTITGWSWNFGDAATSTAQNPSHTYAAGGTYTVSLQVTDNQSHTSTTSKSVTVTAACTPPPAPTGVTATSSSQTGASVSWSASTGATSYGVSRSTTSGGPYTAVGNATTTSFNDSGLACGTTYYYVVSASNGTCSSGNSAQASATTAACSSGGPQTATYDTTLKAPKCGTVGTSCDSGASLLLGRGTLSGGVEPNHPNTINASCADGNSGTFHSDESNDRLKVLTNDGTNFAAGKTVTVQATVWAWSGYTSDHLDLYYAANASSPTWVLIGTLSPTTAGAQTLSGTYTLPAGSLQAVRANFRYGGSASSCTSGSYNDHDDLVFAVQ